MIIYWIFAPRTVDNTLAWIIRVRISRKRTHMYYGFKTIEIVDDQVGMRM